MEDMSLLHPQKRARQELSVESEFMEHSEVRLLSLGIVVRRSFIAGLIEAVTPNSVSTRLHRFAYIVFNLVLNRYKELCPRGDKFVALLSEGIGLACKEFALSVEEPSGSHRVLALSHEAFALSHKESVAINWFPRWSLSLSDWFMSSPDIFDIFSQSNLVPQTQPPQLQLQQPLVGLDLQNCQEQILLLAATDVFETQVQRCNHFFEEWKKARGHQFGKSVPSSYSDMVYKRLQSQWSPWFIEAMDYVESAYLRGLEMRGYGPAIELKEALRQEMIDYLTKAKKEGGRNDVAHLFSTSVKQYWERSSQTPAKVRCLTATAAHSLTQSQKDYRLRILDLLSNSQNLPACYRDLAQVAFPLQIFFLRNVLENSEVKVETVRGQ